MSSEVVRFRDLFSIIYKYKVSIFMIFTITLGFSIQLTNLLEKKYKSEFEVNVYSKYFKNPLISEIIPGVHNIPEMRFTIDSMVKEAISDDFIDQIAQDFDFYQVDGDEVELARNRQLLRDRFLAFSTGGQSYQVTFTDKDPHVAKLVAEKTLDQVKAQFIDSRIETIEMVKQMMLERLQAFNASQKMSSNGTDKALASKSPDVLRGELNKINANISALSKQYNSSHPEILDLIGRKKTIENWLEEFKQNAFPQNELVTITMPTGKTINEQITGKFYTKYHDFNMALDIEKKSLSSYIGVIKNHSYQRSQFGQRKGFLLQLVLFFL